jgi:Holliday junction resolvasome RuvABC ATP-dependent DNA helicase subunit
VSITRYFCGRANYYVDSVAVLEVRLKPRPSLAQNFVGREDVLQAMHQTHIRNRSKGLHTPAITVLSGLGGSGKTQIALRFALDYEEL